MLNKIISGGQTGADQAALDIAIKFNIPHGGWIPKGRKTEDGPLSEQYRLKEMRTADYRERTKKNIEDSSGTVIVSRGPLTGGSQLTLTHAKVVAKPHIHLDLALTEDFEAAIFLKSFILENKVQILNVAGPRLSHAPWIYDDVKMLLEAAFYLLYFDAGYDMEYKFYVPAQPVNGFMGQTVIEAVDAISKVLSLKTKTFIARLPASHMMAVYFTFLDFIRAFVGFDTGNEALLKACAAKSHWQNPTVEDAVMVILKQLKAALEKDHVLRVIE